MPLPYAVLHGTGGKHFRHYDNVQPRRQPDALQEKLPAAFRKPDVSPLSDANHSPQNRTMPVLKWYLFQPTTARRRLHVRAVDDADVVRVSTHSRPKATTKTRYAAILTFSVSTHSRSKAAARFCRTGPRCLRCFNSQPLEGGCQIWGQFAAE